MIAYGCAEGCPVNALAYSLIVVCMWRSPLLRQRGSFFWISSSTHQIIGVNLQVIGVKKSVKCPTHQMIGVIFQIMGVIYQIVGVKNLIFGTDFAVRRAHFRFKSAEIQEI